MATIHFYGKPDCINNRRQKELLRTAGHELIEYDILRTIFMPETLRPFFEERPVFDWFNPTAPAITSGTVNPKQLDENEALQLMLCDRLLIRRPLIRINIDQFCGFDIGRLQKLIGFTPASENRAALDRLLNIDLVTCPRKGEPASCISTQEADNG